MAMTKKEQKLRTTQSSLEKCMLIITKRDRKTNKWIRKQAKMQDIIKQVKIKKWRWAGHFSRTKDNRCGQR